MVYGTIINVQNFIITNSTSGIIVIKFFFRARGGLFQRLIDTWSSLGVPIAFSHVLPKVVDGRIEFLPNVNHLPRNSNEITITDLISFDPNEFAKNLRSEVHESVIERL